MSKKVFSLNNSGTEVQTVFGYLAPKEEVIVIEKVDAHSFVSTVDTSLQLADMDMDMEDEKNDDMLMAKDLLEQSPDNLDDFNIDQLISDSDSEYEHNVSILTKIFQHLEDTNFDMVLNMPPKYIKSIFVNKNFSEFKGSKRDEQIKKEVNNKLDRPINEANFDYLATVDDKVLAFTYEGLPPFFNVYDKVKDQLKIKPNMRMILPVELSLTNLIHFNYQPAEDDVIAIVHITTEMSKIIITKGGRILHISQPITEHANSATLLNKISGRLLFEKDVSSIHHFSKIIISGEREAKDVIDHLTMHFSEEEEIEYFTINPEKFQISPEFYNEDMSKLASALGLLVSQVLYKEHHINYLDLVPDYIKDNQVFFKLSWYNITLLILLALTPIYLSTLYSNKKIEYNQWKQKNLIVTENLNNITWVEKTTDSLDNKIFHIKDELGRIRGISKGSVQLSETLRILGKEIEKTGGLWLENLDYKRDLINISGYSKYRSRIPEFASSFANAEIKSILPKEIRGYTVYQFEITIKKLVENEFIFDPKITDPKKG
jgi:hypothetical protein